MRFNKLVIILSLCVSASAGLKAQPTEAIDKVRYWTKDKPLGFEDFQGKPREDSIAGEERVLHRYGAIVKAIDVHLATKRGKTVITILAGMKKNLSWIRETGDSLTLTHEQGHFDICEIYARILRRDIQEAKSLLEAREIYEKVTADEELEHDQYDKENNFETGGITKEWKKRIMNRLQELALFENPVVTLPIDK